MRATLETAIVGAAPYTAFVLIKQGGCKECTLIIMYVAVTPTVKVL